MAGIHIYDDGKNSDGLRFEALAGFKENEAYQREISGEADTKKQAYIVLYRNLKEAYEEKKKEFKKFEKEIKEAMKKAVKRAAKQSK